jgi:hypothetical protein
LRPLVLAVFGGIDALPQYSDSEGQAMSKIIWNELRLGNDICVSHDGASGVDARELAA